MKIVGRIREQGELNQHFKSGKPEFIAVTGRIWLSPFSLAESEAFFNEIGVVMNRYQIAESLMVFGGVPYYLNMFEAY